jgi:hypothetical protein
MQNCKASNKVSRSYETVTSQDVLMVNCLPSTNGMNPTPSHTHDRIPRLPKHDQSNQHLQPRSPCSGSDNASPGTPFTSSEISADDIAFRDSRSLFLAT